MTRIPAAALVQLLGAALLLGSSWPIARYALLERAGTLATVPGRPRP